jgi:hypothetical protein
MAAMDYCNQELIAHIWSYGLDRAKDMIRAMTSIS